MILLVYHPSRCWMVYHLGQLSTSSINTVRWWGPKPNCITCCYHQPLNGTITHINPCPPLFALVKLLGSNVYPSLPLVKLLVSNIYPPFSIQPHRKKCEEKKGQTTSTIAETRGVHPPTCRIFVQFLQCLNSLGSSPVALQVLAKSLFAVCWHEETVLLPQLAMASNASHL
jgi:hypothetical protein